MARKSLSSAVLEHQERASAILAGLFNISEGAERELVLQAMHELNLIRIVTTRSIAAGQKAPKSVPTSETPLGTAFGADPLAKAQKRARKAVAKP